MVQTAQGPARPHPPAMSWTALDRLADRAGFSPSRAGQARRPRSHHVPTLPSASPPTAANAGPSTRGICFKALASTTPRRNLRAAARRRPRVGPPFVPLLALAQAVSAGRFDDSGFPSARAGNSALPSARDDHAYGLELSGDL